MQKQSLQQQLQIYKEQAGLIVKDINKLQVLLEVDEFTSRDIEDFHRNTTWEVKFLTDKLSDIRGNFHTYLKESLSERNL